VLHHTAKALGVIQNKEVIQIAGEMAVYRKMKNK
jgi:hypothetical protein